jgi:hypothetical protein
MKPYIYMAFLALIIFLSLVIGMLNPDSEGFKSVITHDDEKYVVDGTYTQTGNEIRDVNGKVVQFSDIKAQKILAKEYISFVEDTAVGRVFAVKGYYNDLPTTSFTFTYKDNEGVTTNDLAIKRTAPNPTITKGTTELEIVNINLSDTDKNTLNTENIKYAKNDNSGERFQLPKEPIVNRYRTSTDDADGDSQYKIIDGKVVKNEDWNADTAFPDYHDSASVLASNDPRIKAGKMYVKGPNGEIIEVPWTGQQTPINYNESGYFRFQPSNFVPGYEDSVYLSRLTGYSTTKPVENTASQMGGFCDYHKYSPIKKEEACSKLDKNSCASTNCCVLLGGSRCVGGNEKGPTMKSHYGDITILNRDHYYYQGKCYGNCPR